ncbi:hypothetical protein JCM10914A_52110 [Paenibacillus sp. JCM 10914]|uniref:hypothetical protein n=1 Tax=Paenibacillus sp. JCM 10914 TaxID=1236974 RepID=UPI0003CC614C|nr:hypothetical protein [Paenibacillus sp. JCM 10914]GAE05078.1 hypothetical protein JCM10914_1164 [Paenibacillus sp. JCM 10914]
MPIVRPLMTDPDFQEVMDQGIPIRIFKDNHLIESGSRVIRFTDDTIITQSSVSSLGYHKREECEFFEVRK